MSGMFKINVMLQLCNFSWRKYIALLHIKVSWHKLEDWVVLNSVVVDSDELHIFMSIKCKIKWFEPKYFCPKIVFYCIKWNKWTNLKHILFMMKVCGLSRKAWPKILNKLKLFTKTEQHKGKASQKVAEYLPTYLLLQKTRLNFDSIQHARKSLRPHLLFAKNRFACSLFLQ